MHSIGRKGWVLLLLLAAAAALAAVQNRAYSRGTPSPIQQPAILVLRPLQACIAAFSDLWGHLTGGAASSSDLAAENRRLRTRVDLLTVRNEHLQHVAAENDRLRQLLKMKAHDAAGSRWVAADVVERHPSQWFELLTLDRGSRSGIRQHSVVLTALGLVGQVVMVRGDSADVLLLTDPSSSAGAFVARTHDVGYVQGTGHEELVLNFFDHDHGVKIGDSVVSSPFSAVYPSGILIGRVTDITQEPGTFARRAIVKPAVQFNNLEEALVIP